MSYLKTIKPMEVILAIIAILALIVVALFYSSFAWGYVVSKFYVWFILPIYPEAPQFTIMQFVGIMFFLGAILPKFYAKDVKKEYRENEHEWAVMVLAPWITLICGWVIHLAY